MARALISPRTVAALTQAAGTTVVVRRATVAGSPDWMATVKAVIRQGTPETFLADRHVAEHLVTIGAADPGWAGFPAPPAAGDTLDFFGGTHLVVGVERRPLGDADGLYVLTTRSR